VTLSEPVSSTVLDPRHRMIGRLAGAARRLDPTVKVWPL
jgi:hypothetical protein